MRYDRVFQTATKAGKRRRGPCALLAVAFTAHRGTGRGHAGQPRRRTGRWAGPAGGRAKVAAAARECLAGRVTGRPSVCARAAFSRHRERLMPSTCSLQLKRFIATRQDQVQSGYGSDREQSSPSLSLLDKNSGRVSPWSVLPVLLVPQLETIPLLQGVVVVCLVVVCC